MIFMKKKAFELIFESLLLRFRDLFQGFLNVYLQIREEQSIK